MSAELPVKLRNWLQ